MHAQEEHSPSTRVLLHDDGMSGVAAVVDGWVAELEQLKARIGRRLGRLRPRLRARDYLAGPVAGLARTAGSTPYRCTDRTGAPPRPGGCSPQSGSCWAET